MDLDAPALAAPEGVTPNFDDPSNRNGLGRAVIVITSVFTTICFLLRIYGRVILTRKFQVEEVLAIVAYGCFWGCIWAMIRFEGAPGYFVHQYDIHLRELITTQYLILIFGICFAVVLPSLKAAILTEWCRIFIPSDKRKSPFWWVSVVVIFTQVVASVAIIVALNTQCTPYKSIWYITTDRKCWDIYALQVVVAAIHLTGDLVIFLLPQQRIWRLKMTIKRKLGISFVFSLGLIACAAAAARLGVTVINKTTKDNTYKLATLLFWAATEMSCGFFVLCIPCLPNILRENAIARGLKRKFGIKTNSQRSHSTGLETFGGSNSQPRHGKGSAGGSRSRSYAKLQGNTYALETLGDSESQENLRHNVQSHTPPGSQTPESQTPEPQLESPKGLTVVRTTKVTVVEEERTSQECGSTSRAYVRSRDGLRNV